MMDTAAVAIFVFLVSLSPKHVFNFDFLIVKSYLALFPLRPFSHLFMFYNFIFFIDVNKATFFVFFALQIRQWQPL